MDSPDRQELQSRQFSKIYHVYSPCNKLQGGENQLHRIKTNHQVVSTGKKGNLKLEV